MSSPPKQLTGRKLLVASVGLATVSYVGCVGQTSGNLVPPPDGWQGDDPAVDAATRMAPDAARDLPPLPMGNLLPPPIRDASPDPGSEAGADAAGDGPGDGAHDAPSERGDSHE